MNELPIPTWADPEVSSSLLRLCMQGESQTLEFKEKLPIQGHDIGKAVAAFASSNTGRILYGIADDGRLVGLDGASDAAIRDQVQRRLMSAAKEVKPPVHPQTTWAIHEGKVVCILEIEKGLEPIYYSNHRPFIRRGPMSRPAEAGEVEALFRARYAGGTSAIQLPSTQQIAERMNRVLEMMNVDRFEPLTVSDLARALDLASPADLDQVLTGQSPATFALLDQFSARFAIDKEWLATGRSAPFESPIQHRVSPEDSKALIEELAPEKVFLVRSTSEVGEAFIVVKSDPHKFWRLPDVWHVSGHVGGGGSHDLLKLYQLFRHWSTAQKSHMVLGREIDAEGAEAIFNSDTFPGIVENMSLSYWWDDLTDLDHKWTSRESSRKAYGDGFIDAQDIIRKMLASDAQ